MSSVVLHAALRASVIRQKRGYEIWSSATVDTHCHVKKPGVRSRAAGENVGIFLARVACQLLHYPTKGQYCFLYITECLHDESLANNILKENVIEQVYKDEQSNQLNSAPAVYWLVG